MYQALYRKWRPRTFDEVCGQNHITSILQKQCQEDRVSHAYLFCGTRGTGKTSMAKILAKAVNCEHPVNGNPCNCCYSCTSIDAGNATDVLEIDAASNNGVDDIRGLRDEVMYPPSMLKKRVYIIDEVHMLSTGAFNALLKTLEEPPEYIVFILATTELNKLPATIISRCMRFDFKRLSEEIIASRLKFVAEHEQIVLGEGTPELLARLADGAMRDGLSILEACTNGIGESNSITVEQIETRLGLAGASQLVRLFNAIADKDTASALNVIEEVHSSSKDLSVFLDDMSTFAVDMLVMRQIQKAHGKFTGTYRYPKEEASVLRAYPAVMTIEMLTYICSVLEDTQTRISRYGTDKKLLISFSIIRMCDVSLSENPKAMLARIAALEKKMASGIPASVPAEQQNVLFTEEELPAEKPVESTPVAPQKSVPESPKPEPFTMIAELAEELVSHPDLLPYVQKISAVIDGNKFIISADSFTNTVLKFGRNPTFLSDALKVLTGKTFVFDYINVAPDKKSNPIDEL